MSLNNRGIASKCIKASIIALVLLLAGCRPADRARPALPHVSAPAAAATPTAANATSRPTSEPATRPDGLSAGEAATLASLEKVDGFPLYTMRYSGGYDDAGADGRGGPVGPRWGCSLFAALGGPQDMLFGRNFDWEFSPALLLFTDPPGGYASVSMVDIAYLGFTGSAAHTVADLPLAERRRLLDAHMIPFDGLNEKGLAVGMAAVPPGEMVPDPAKPTLGSLGVIRQMLDHAADVDEAIDIIQGTNIDMEGGPPLHYLLADRSGRSVLVEFFRGETVLLPNGAPWHLATNFLRAAAGDSPLGECSRYDKIHERLSQAAGRLGRQEAFDLLSDVSQVGTQWSVVYGLTTGEVSVVMGRQYGSAHPFRLDQGP